MGRERPSLAARIEAILFVASAPVGVGRLAGVLGVSPREVERALEELAEGYTVRGLRLQKHQSGYQMTTAPEAASDVEHFLDVESTTRLSRAALEVLAITAYQQPVTRPQIESIRGVNSESPLRTLLRSGLLEEVGRSEGPGRPILYATTPEFLQYFGLGSLEELPAISREVKVPEAVSGRDPERGELRNGVE